MDNKIVDSVSLIMGLTDDLVNISCFSIDNKAYEMRFVNKLYDMMYICVDILKDYDHNLDRLAELSNNMLKEYEKNRCRGMDNG